MVPRIMSTDDALRFISGCADSGVAVVYLDGFHVEGDRYREDHDLMFTADEDCAPVEAASAAMQFIHENERPDVVWEVWSADMKTPPSA